MSLKHVFETVYADGADATKLRPSNWGRTGQDYGVSPTHEFTGGDLGSLLYRDTGAVDGSGWLADVAVGAVLVSGGVGAAPAWSATPTLTSLTVTSLNGLRVDMGNTSQFTNTAIGVHVLDNVVDGTVEITHGGTTFNATGNYNTGVGMDALRELTHGEDNVAVGAQALRDNTDGMYNSAVGHYALGATTTGFKNVGVGAFALNDNTTGDHNTGVGYRALNGQVVAFRNVGIGSDAMLYNTAGNDNTAVGWSALSFNQANNNTGIGKAALYDVTSGGANTALGYESGRGLTTGTGNTILGALVTVAPGLTNNIILANGTGAIKAQHDGSSWSFGLTTFTNTILLSTLGQITWNGLTNNTINLQGLSGKAVSIGTNAIYDRFYFSTDGNCGVGVTGFGASAQKVVGVGNGTEPTTSPADMVQLYSVDLSAGNATLGIRTETAVVTESVTSDRTLSVRINGTTYKLCLKA